MLLLLGFRLGVAGALRLLLLTNWLAGRGALLLLAHWLFTAGDRGRLVTEGSFGQGFAAGTGGVLLTAAREGCLLAGRLLLADGHAGRLLLLLAPGGSSAGRLLTDGHARGLLLLLLRLRGLLALGEGQPVFLRLLLTWLLLTAWRHLLCCTRTHGPVTRWHHTVSRASTTYGTCHLTGCWHHLIP